MTCVCGWSASAESRVVVEGADERERERGGDYRFDGKELAVFHMSLIREDKNDQKFA